MLKTFRTKFDNVRASRTLKVMQCTLHSSLHWEKKWNFHSLEPSIISTVRMKIRHTLLLWRLFALFVGLLPLPLLLLLLLLNAPFFVHLPYIHRRTQVIHIFYGKSLILPFLHDEYNVVVLWWMVKYIDALSHTKFTEAHWMPLQIANVNSLLNTQLPLCTLAAYMQSFRVSVVKQYYYFEINACTNTHTQTHAHLPFSMEKSERTVYTRSYQHLLFCKLLKSISFSLIHNVVSLLARWRTFLRGSPMLSHQKSH